MPPLTFEIKAEIEVLYVKESNIMHEHIKENVRQKTVHNCIYFYIYSCIHYYIHMNVQV
jgi:hypothetical protein